MTMCMGGKLTRKIGLARNEAWWGLNNLTINFLRYLQRRSHVTAMLRWASCNHRASNLQPRAVVA
jgi:hypothetical protein